MLQETALATTTLELKYGARGIRPCIVKHLETTLDQVMLKIIGLLVLFNTALTENANFINNLAYVLINDKPQYKVTLASISIVSIYSLFVMYKSPLIL